jgi:hypothetical protein
MGHSDVVVPPMLLEDDNATDEWHDGVLRAESPADSAMCISGRWGRPQRL